MKTNDDSIDPCETDVAVNIELDPEANSVSNPFIFGKNG